jgi:hypothetical protein
LLERGQYIRTFLELLGNTHVLSKGGPVVVSPFG